jgi:hypothetical protein
VLTEIPSVRSLDWTKIFGAPAGALQHLGFALHSPICCQVDLGVSGAARAEPGVGSVRSSVMRAFIACRGCRPWLFPALGWLALALAIAVFPASGFAKPGDSTLRDAVVVHLDQAALLKLPEGTATLVIGNPLIADAAVQGSSMVITAKSYGMTNLIVLSRNGETVAEYPIQVVGPADKLVVVYRGIERETYSCAPNCEKRITLGDSLQYFTQNLNAFNTFNGQVSAQSR